MAPPTFASAAATPNSHSARDGNADWYVEVVLEICCSLRRLCTAEQEQAHISMREYD